MDDTKAITAWELIRELTRSSRAPESEILIEINGKTSDAVSIVPETRNGKPVFILVDYP